MFGHGPIPSQRSIELQPTPSKPLRQGLDPRALDLPIHPLAQGSSFQIKLDRADGQTWAVTPPAGAGWQRLAPFSRGFRDTLRNTTLPGMLLQGGGIAVDNAGVRPV